MTRRLAAAAILVALLAALFAFKASAKMADFEVYWRAGNRALAAEPLYRAEDEHYQFKYLPAFALLATPLAVLPLPVAKAVWFGISAALIPVVLALGVRLLPARNRPAAWLAAITFVVMAKFYGHELVLGQVNLLLAAIVIAAVHLLRRGREPGAGLLIALAVVIKPYAVIVLPWLAARRAVAAAVFASGGLGAALLVPAAVYGVAGNTALHLAWWRTVTESTAPNLLNPDNVSLAAMFAKWIGPGRPAAIMAAVSGVLLLALAAAVVALRGRVSQPDGLDIALLLTTMPLLSPQGWDYVFLLATPAVLYLVNYDRQLPVALRALTWLALALVAFSLYDVMGRDAYGRFMAWSVISVCFLTVAAALAALRIRRIA